MTFAKLEAPDQHAHPRMLSWLQITPLRCFNLPELYEQHQELSLNCPAWRWVPLFGISRAKDQ